MVNCGDVVLPKSAMKVRTQAALFYLEPLHKVDEDDIVKLVPGTFDIKLIKGKLIIRPKPEYQNQNWIMPLQHKRSLAEEHKAYCVIVELDPISPKVEEEDIRTHG